VFTYSHEEGTRAYSLVDDVRGPVKRARRNRLMAIQKKIVAARQRARVGRPVRVMVDGPSPEHGLVLRGRLATQAPEIDSCVYLTEADPAACPPGTLLDGIVAAARGYDLVVRPAE
jgi:ribosomal protein S12 methylthiotransferase